MVHQKIRESDSVEAVLILNATMVLVNTAILVMLSVKIIEAVRAK